MFRKIISSHSKSKTRKFVSISHNSTNYCYYDHSAPPSSPSKHISPRQKWLDITPTSSKGFNRSFSAGYQLNSTHHRGSNLNRRNRFSVLRRGFSSETVRECINYDVVIVGGGPAGLSAAIRLKQLCRDNDVDLSVCVVEKGAEVGAHILSGNVFEPRALNELIPRWREEEAPISVSVSSDKFMLLTEKHAIPLPNPFDNKGNYVISLSQFVRWLGQKAEELGVEVYPGFAAKEVLFDENENVIGIATNDMGIGKDGSKKDNFQPGVELKGRINLFAEGCRGSLSEKLIKKYNLREKGQGQQQTYALGIKEVWEIDASKHKPGAVVHTLGWPLDHNTYGGSFLYHMQDNQVSIGLVCALNYHNPYFSPYDEFQKLKGHPAIRPLLENGTVIQYGARTLNEGGFQIHQKFTLQLFYSISSVPWGSSCWVCSWLLECSKNKGYTYRHEIRMLAAESAFGVLNKGSNMEIYWENLKNSWIWEELHRPRNYRPACDIKDPKQNIEWTVLEGGGGPGYSLM